jgi:hypothetical protein
MFQCFELRCGGWGEGGGIAAFNGTNVNPRGVRSVNTEQWWKDN